MAGVLIGWIPYLWVIFYKDACSEKEQNLRNTAKIINHPQQQKMGTLWLKEKQRYFALIFEFFPK